MQSGVRLKSVMTCVLIVLAASNATWADDSAHPIPEEQQKEMQAGLLRQIEAATAAIDSHPDSLDLYSRRGDARFFAGKFADAVRDYDQMVKLDPETDASQWRRGIAYFFTEEYSKGAAQFTRYHAFDNVDRENGIWRYLCQYKAQGKEAARKELLKYEKDDREPFGDIYKLFTGEITEEEVLQRVAERKLGPDQRANQLFYAELYVGLNELVEGRSDSARQHLREATANSWGKNAGYGPHYMWHVGRLQYESLLKTPTEPANIKPKPSAD